MLQKVKEHRKAVSVGIFLIYAAVTLTGVLCHENWYDEAQAWVIVRENSLSGIFNILQYEGHPPLWFLILYPFVRLNFPITAVSWISWSFSVITAGIILQKAPFGTGFKTAILFSCGFLFYNSVSSRIYCVIVLLLCLLAALYKDRKKHPVIFGVLVGLLAITHVVMCGLVGIIGIYMLTDFFRDLKTNSAKQNQLNTAGLLAAGAGVAILVTIGIFYIRNSSMVKRNPLTAAELFKRFSHIFTCIGQSIFPYNENMILTPIVCGIVTALIILYFFFLRKYKKALAAAVIFSAFYFFTTQIIFTIMIPSRASVYIYTLICIFWAAKNSESPSGNTIHIDNSKMDSALLKKISEKFCQADKHFEHSVSVVLCLLCIISMPRGIYWLVRDCLGPYTAEPAAAKFIKENLLSENSILVTYDLPCAALLAADPDIRLYDPEYKEFINYTRPYILDDEQKKKNRESSHPLLQGYEHIYQISIAHSNVSEGTDVSPVEIVPIYELLIPNTDNYIQGYVLIYEMSAEAFR